MAHIWRRGDRAKCIYPGTRLEEDCIYEVAEVNGPLLRTVTPGFRWYSCTRFKPVVRVPAICRPTPETYAECRLAHGPSRYTTGFEVFRGWPRYKEQGE